MKFSEWFRRNRSRYRAVLFDLDGTIIRGRHALPGAAGLLAELRGSGYPYYFLTNDSNNSAAQKCEIVRRTGLECS